jgi:heme oxygenase
MFTLRRQEGCGVKASERLKKDTLSVHKEVESLLLSLLVESPTPEAYFLYLKSLLELYHCWELELSLIAEIDPCLSQMDYFRRRKLHLLQGDLEELRAQMGNKDLYPRPYHASEFLRQLMPSLESPTGRLGLLYVVEGAVLGGAVIAQRIRRVSREMDQLACLFLRPYGDDTLKLWNLFKDVVDRYIDAHPGEYNDLIHAARKTFGMFATQFSFLLSKLRSVGDFSYSNIPPSGPKVIQVGQV